MTRRTDIIGNSSFLVSLLYHLGRSALIYGELGLAYDVETME